VSVSVSVSGDENLTTHHFTYMSVSFYYHIH
jgi:hypothetical protein